MIYLHQFTPYFNIPNASPPCMKVETYLRLAKVEHQTIHIVGDLRKTPRGQAPYITHEGVDIPDSTLILKYLKKTFGDPLGEGLDEQDWAQHEAIRHMLEDHLYFIMLAERWTVPENMEVLKNSFFAPVPKMMRNMVFRMAQKGAVKRLQGHGLGKFSRDERQEMGREAIDHLSVLLGESNYFGGDKAREIDCIVLPYLANGMITDFNTPLSDYMRSKPNLISYKERMMKEVFPDFPSESL